MRAVGPTEVLTQNTKGRVILFYLLTISYNINVQVNAEACPGPKEVYNLRSHSLTTL